MALSALLLLLAAQPSTKHLEKVAVLPPNVSDSAAEFITKSIFEEAILAVIHAAGDFAVVGHDDLNSVLGFERQKELLGCEESSCLAEIGGALGVEKLIDVKLDASGEKWTLTAKVIDISSPTPKVDARRFARIEGDEDALLKALPSLFNGLLSDAGLPLKGAAQPMPKRIVGPRRDHTMAGVDKTQNVLPVSVTAKKTPFESETKKDPALDRPRKDYQNKKIWGAAMAGAGAVALATIGIMASRGGYCSGEGTKGAKCPMSVVGMFVSGGAVVGGSVMVAQSFGE